MRTMVLLIALAGMTCACDQFDNMSSGQKGMVTGAALGTGIGLVSGGSFGTVVGAGLIGGAVGYVGGTAIGNKN